MILMEEIPPPAILDRQNQEITFPLKGDAKNWGQKLVSSLHSSGAVDVLDLLAVAASEGIPADDGDFFEHLD